MEDAFESGWSTCQEDVLERICYNAAQMAEHHRVGYYELINQLKYYKIPVIIISSLNSVFAVGLNGYITQDIVSTITCLLSLLVSCISSIELYLSLQRRSDSELVSYRAFYNLSLKISTTLKLDRVHRQGDGDTFLTQMISEYQSCFENALANGLGDDDRLVELKEIKNL
jgi:hypothetical protein